MSFFFHRPKKIKYEVLPAEKKDENDVLISDGISLDEVNLLINNFVDPGDTDNSRTRKLNFREKLSQTWEVMTTEQQELECHKFRKSLSDVDARKHATFMRLKRRLENLKNFYPDVYYSDQNVMELWGRGNELKQVNLDLLEYDKDSPSWLWI